MFSFQYCSYFVIVLNIFLNLFVQVSTMASSSSSNDDQGTEVTHAWQIKFVANFVPHKNRTNQNRSSDKTGSITRNTRISQSSS